MKNIFTVAAIAVCAAACQRAIVPAVTATPINQEIKSESGQTILVGKATLSSMQKQPYKTWFDESYNTYQPDAATVQQLKNAFVGKRMEIFLGSWCGDSKREVPRMIKIMRQAGMDTTRLSIVFVDNSSAHYKQSPQHEEAGKNIVRVPTFIVYEGQTEKGRIVETPSVSLEKDLLGILRR